MDIKGCSTGPAVTVTIGGSAYTFNMTYVALGFSSDSGNRQQEAQAYFNDIKEEYLTSWNEIGASHIVEGYTL